MGEALRLGEAQSVDELSKNASPCCIGQRRGGPTQVLFETAASDMLDREVGALTADHKVEHPRDAWVVEAR